MENIKDSQVFRVLSEIANLNFVNPCCNERYLHHHFTEKIQKEYPIVYGDVTKSKLHPEWATKNQSRVNGGKYKKKDNIYVRDDKGSSGFIDFVLGDYYKPEMGIEFKILTSWKFQSIVFDYMKLMDRNNSIQKVISFLIIFRKKGFSNQLNLMKINDTIIELKERLGKNLDNEKEFLFWIIEVNLNSPNSNKMKHWYCDNIDAKFQEMKPDCTQLH